MKSVHPVYHVSQLEPIVPNTSLNWVQPPLPPVISMPNPPSSSSPILTLSSSHPQDFALDSLFLHLRHLFSLPLLFHILYLLLVSFTLHCILMILHWYYIISHVLLHHHSSFICLLHSLSLSTYTSYLSICFSILTSDPQSDHHSI